ncbi:hypothetical protein LTR94_028626, partial [Friedmanniomyces endolithicus]
GVEPLGERVRAPEALAARLAMCGLAPRAQAADLAQRLPVGARLVTIEGDLFRWDGFVSRADAPRPAAIRLGQRSRLAELESEIDRGKPALEAAQAAQKAALEAFRASEESVKQARLKPFAADKALNAARERTETLSRDQARREARALALDETLARLQAEVAEAEAALEAVQSVSEPSETIEDQRQQLVAARAQAETARNNVQTARSERDQEARDRQGREQRQASLTRAREGWVSRSKDSATRIAALTRDAEKAEALLKQAEVAPRGFAEQRSQLLDALTA